MKNWRVVRFDPGSVAGVVFGFGFTEAEANEYVDILDRRFASTGTIFFAECETDL